MSDIVEFLRARLDEDAAAATGFGPSQWRHDPAWHDRVLREVAAKRAILEAYEQWPVLIEGPPEFEQGGDLASITMRMSQQVQWVTTREYVNRFGEQPPPAPMVRALAAVYADHPDYDDRWAT